eukprot:TRINITY_DN45304_c0_g1_i1.p2 TRINITY_DN45304_c0_g1~~TRINITY_DN45304_c0_g1_i1.p2  ORF type:complete len:125 (-),score=29.36 TRINITY_DN45304_c0_g1_i1:400-774(-)
MEDAGFGLIQATTVARGELWPDTLGGAGTVSAPVAASETVTIPRDSHFGFGHQSCGDDEEEEDERTRQPAEATEEERAEAGRIVRDAFRDAREREVWRERVKKAESPADLQALLNARLSASNRR